MKKKIFFFLVCVISNFGTVYSADHHSLRPLILRAIAVIYPTKGNSVTGIVTFETKPDGTHIHAELHGLTPGKHGFHIHELGDCSCDDGMCTQGHFNPTNQPHAGLDSPNRHSGDLGNIIADEQGNATLSIINQQIRLNGPYSIVGRSIIVHADEDDLVSQPSGNAGDRIGCGVIGIAEEKK